MHSLIRRGVFAVFTALALLFAPAAYGFDPFGGQSAGNSGTIYGTVADATGAVIPGAKITIQNPVSGLNRQTVSDGAGKFQFTNLPLNPYHMMITAAGFGAHVQDVDVTSFVPVNVAAKLNTGATTTEVTVEAGDLIEADTTDHTDIDRGLFDKLPLESASSSLSSLVTLASPGVAADSNGLFHGLGDHASNSFSIDGQPITDQQSKVFSNQIPTNSVQSLEVIDGAPPAEFGGKTSLVIVATTRSGQGVTTPTGSVSASYGSFGSPSGSVDLSYGGKSWGNFIEVDGLNTGRFLDPPEFAVFHDKGNEFNVFDRVDYSLTSVDSIHLNVNVSRSWFQTPNTFDNLGVQNISAGGATSDPTFGTVGDTDQRSKIVTYNIAPTYTRTVGPNSVFNLGFYDRHDDYNYYPSKNPLADLGPIQGQSIVQARTLNNFGVRSDFSYVKGIHNFKAGATYQQTLLRERDSIGLVDSTFNAPCTDASGSPQSGFSDPGQCNASGLFANDGSIDPNLAPFDPNLRPYDLTRGGSYFNYFGHTDVKELALYIQDQITAGNWLFNVGIRGDLYNGLAIARQAEPRVGVAYTIKQSNTVLRASYARTLETPFNENLVLSSLGCSNDVLNPLLACQGGNAILTPGFRNEFHAGLQQAFGKYFVVSGDYIWKYTHNAFDFAILGNTPIFFPIDWHNSKIPGYTLRADVPNFHHVSAFVVMSSVAARFFPPQAAGAGAAPGGGFPFRIDHDEKFNETTHLQYSIPIKTSPWFGFNWRYDSGLVAGATPCYNAVGANTLCGNFTINGQPAVDLSGLTPDQQFQAGLACNGVKATPTSGFDQCLASQFTSNLLSIPAANTEDDDHNPPRVAPRNVFDMSLGFDNLLNGDKNKWSLRVTAVNVTNKYALYNFLSTFSGTHYLTPRAVTGELAYHF